MKVNWYGNACVRVSSDSGHSILCDPWVNGGAFLGSWYQWPPIDPSLEQQLLIEPCDGLYISHLHPDHYDPKFIAKFSKNRPEVPIYVATFAHPWLLRSIKAVVAPGVNVIELPTLSEFRIAENFTIKVFAADTCNPVICGVNIPCNIEPSLRGIDSIAVFKADSQVIVNANDAMGVNLVSRIASNIGEADLIMGHYGGASPFPQCFEDVSDKLAAGIRVVDATCKMLIQAADSINAKLIMPFAGQYVLGGRLSDLNSSRATVPLDKAVAKLRLLTNRKIISIMPGGEIDLTSGEATADYVEPSEDRLNSYLARISKKKFPYEKKEYDFWGDMDLDLLASANRVVSKAKSSIIPFANSFIIGDGENFVTINLDSNWINSSALLGSHPAYETVTEITMPRNLLKNLATRKVGYTGFTSMHWNQADVGSHFKWKRKGEFDLTSHLLLNFFGT